jgi:hypothetical protein
LNINFRGNTGGITQPESSESQSQSVQNEQSLQSDTAGGFKSSDQPEPGNSSDPFPSTLNTVENAASNVYDAAKDAAQDIKNFFGF